MRSDARKRLTETDPHADNGFTSDARKRAREQCSPTSEAAYAWPEVREIVADALTGALHPEFGTEWREPDGIIWRAIREAQATAWDYGYRTGSEDMHAAVSGAGSAASRPNPYREVS